MPVTTTSSGGPPSGPRGQPRGHPIECDCLSPYESEETAQLLASIAELPFHNGWTLPDHGQIMLGAAWHRIPEGLLREAVDDADPHADDALRFAALGFAISRQAPWSDQARAGAPGWS
jgi:hypothetical protein